MAKKKTATAESVFSQLLSDFSTLNEDEQRKLRELIQDSSRLASGAAAFMILERQLQNMAILPDAIAAKSRRATDRKNKKADTHALMVEIQSLKATPHTWQEVFDALKMKTGRWEHAKSMKDAFKDYRRKGKLGGLQTRS